MSQAATEQCFRVTYYSSRYWGFVVTRDQKLGWLRRAQSALGTLFPGAEVRVLEIDESSSVSFGGEVPQPLDYSEPEVRDLMQTEWERFVGNL